MSNGGVLGRRNVLGLDSVSGVWELGDVADAARTGFVFPGVDTFDTDTTSLYTQSSDSPATWAVSGGEMVATGGTESVFIRNGVSMADGYVEADVNFAYNGGLVLRFKDNSNYYLLALWDDSGAGGGFNLRIFKRAGGAPTGLHSSIDISWTRGQSKKIRFQAIGTTLSAYVDDSAVVSLTDTSIAGAGGIGMRNTTAGQQSKYQNLRWGQIL